MVTEDEDQSDREGVYLGRIWARYKGWWWCSILKAVVAIWKLIRWRTESQCRLVRTGVIWQYRDFWATTRARVFWTIWRRARFDADVPARRVRADYCHGYRFCCFDGQGWTNVTQSPNVEVWCLTNLGNMPIERHNYENLDKHLDFFIDYWSLIGDPQQWWSEQTQPRQPVVLTWGWRKQWPQT